MSFVPSTSFFDAKPAVRSEKLNKKRVPVNLSAFKPMNTLEPPPPPTEEPPEKVVESAPIEDPTSEEVKDTEDTITNKKK